MKRYIEEHVIKDLEKKIVLVSGPRQTGKTTLSKMLSEDYDYLNFDNPADRERIVEQSWNRKKELIIFDELHKMKNWKSFIKGVYDVEGIPPRIAVTGSARLDIIRKMGDSLAGRYFQYRLHPLDPKEASGLFDPDKALDRILNFGGFPEPFLEGNKIFYRRWQKTHLDIILRQDLVDLQSVQDIIGIETLIYMLKSRVGSRISYSSLARDLQKDHKTIKNWLTLLENLYVIFAVRPWHDNIARAILKEPKYYFYDTGQVNGNEGTRLENAAACSLKKQLDYLEDVFGKNCGLFYIQNKQGAEIDFTVCQDNIITHCFEVKLSDGNLSKNFSILKNGFRSARRIQLVKNMRRSKTYRTGEEMHPAADYLAKIDLND